MCFNVRERQKHEETSQVFTQKKYPEVIANQKRVEKDREENGMTAGEMRKANMEKQFKYVLSDKYIQQIEHPSLFELLFVSD